ncbi:MAG TPA: ribonuclease R, partial [Arenimonas sp.]|nr:ribonuclease R [Arenimonas sp.]
MKKSTRKPSGGTKRPPWMPDSMQLSTTSPAKPGKAAGGKVKAKAAASATSKPGFAKPGKFAGKPGVKPGKGAAGSAPVSRRGSRVDAHAEREAAKYAQPIISREALTEFLSDAPGPMTAEEIAQKLKLTAPDRFEALSRRLGAMQRDGQLLVNRRGGYAVAEQLDLIAGSVIAHPDGFGFLKPEKGGDDLFLPPAEMRKCLHGDRVLASVAGVDYRGRREAAIVEVLEQRLTRIVGRYSERAGIGSVIPDDKRILAELMIPTLDKNGAKDGQIVVCEIIEAPSKGR